MIISILFLVLGLALLIKGADWLVNGASALAKKYQVSDLAIGLTIVAFGTSAPELVVNSIASFQNHQDIVFGNVIGSNNFNLFIILGIAGLISPLTVQSSTIWKEIPISLGATVLLYLLANAIFPGQEQLLSRIDGALLLFLFLLFLFYVYKQLKNDPAEVSSEATTMANYKIWLLIAVGLTGLVWGGRLVVNNAIEIAQSLQISEKIIGLTIVAAGTSLPELATSVVAAVKKNNDIAVGNIIGSNIFNILFILPVSALIKPIPFDLQFNTDLYILAGGTVLLFAAMFSGKKKRLDRWEAALLLIFYLFFIIRLVMNQV